MKMNVARKICGKVILFMIFVCNTCLANDLPNEESIKTFVDSVDVKLDGYSAKIKKTSVYSIASVQDGYNQDGIVKNATEPETKISYLEMKKLPGLIRTDYYKNYKKNTLSDLFYTEFLESDKSIRMFKNPDESFNITINSHSKNSWDNFHLLNFLSLGYGHSLFFGKKRSLIQTTDENKPTLNIYKDDEKKVLLASYWLDKTKGWCWTHAEYYENGTTRFKVDAKEFVQKDNLWYPKITVFISLINNKEYTSRICEVLDINFIGKDASVFNKESILLNLDSIKKKTIINQ